MNENKIFNISKAKKAGYSDEDIAEHFAEKIGRRFNFEKARKAGYSDEEIAHRLSEEVRNSPEKTFKKNPESGEYERHYGIGSTALEHPVETGVGLATDLITKPLETVAGLSEPGGILKSVIGKLDTPLSDKIREIAGIEDLDDLEKQDIDVTGTALSFLPIGGAGAKGISKIPGKKSVPKSNKLGSSLSREQMAAAESMSEPERFASGLTKPRAVSAKRPELGIVTPQQQEKTIQGLNNEAARLTEESLHKRLPKAKQIEEGFDFGSQYEKQFGELKETARKFNPEIDITPVSDFLTGAKREYRGIPKLHTEGRAVMSEIKAFQRNPQNGLSNLLKIYRSNNKKLKGIYERRLMSGSQAEYVSFLEDMNKSISNSIVNTLGEESPWVQKFLNMNKDYKGYKDSLNVLNMLKPAMEEVNASNLRKLALDPKKQKKLKIYMGEEGANEIIQIGKDLEEASNAIKKMNAKEISDLDKVAPLSIFLKGFGKLGLVKGVSYGRRAYGYFLSSPRRRTHYDKILKAIKNKDIEEYSKLVSEIDLLSQ